MTRPEILDTAKSCVCGDREHDYGTPENNFGLIAELWNCYCGRLCFTAKDVANMMILLKIARIKNGGGTGDSYVDIAGYAACGGELLANNENSKESNTNEIK